MKKHLFCLICLMAFFSLRLYPQTVSLPPNFDWSDIPSSYAGKTLLVKFHHQASNAVINLPSRVVLKFTGGSLSSYKSLRGNQATLFAGNEKILDVKGEITGTFVNTLARPEWFGAVGDGKADDGAAVAAAIRAFQQIAFTGQYFIPEATLRIEKPTELLGEKNAKITGNGGDVGRFFVAHTLTVKNITFSNFRYCFYINQENMLENLIFSDNTFLRIEKPIFAPISNTVQKLRHVKVSGNRFTQCTAGVELFAHLQDVKVCENSFLDLGNKTQQKQSNAIRLGNTAHDYHQDQTIGDYEIYGNTIRNVFCGQNMQGGEGFECHGIFALGNRVKIYRNNLENVYNGGVKDNPRIRTGSEGIYVKANDCHIFGNTLVNAGFGEGSVAVKGFNSGAKITGNVVKYTEDLADYAQVITCYFRDEILIEDNILVSNASLSTGVKLCGWDKKAVIARVNRNKQFNIKGFGFKIINQYPGSRFYFTGNQAVSIEGDMLKEESKFPYELFFNGNTITLKDGFLLPSSKFNDLSFSNNTAEITGNAKTNTLWNPVTLEGNKFTIHAVSTEALITFYSSGKVTGNTFTFTGGWRFVMALDGNEPVLVSNNVFNLAVRKGRIETIIYINHKISGLDCMVEKNRFAGSPGEGSAALISVSHKGLNKLTLDGNKADSYPGVFLSVTSPVEYACLIHNTTDCKRGFLSPASRTQITRLYACDNLQLPDTP